MNKILIFSTMLILAGAGCVRPDSVDQTLTLPAVVEELQNQKPQMVEKEEKPTPGPYDNLGSDTVSVAPGMTLYRGAYFDIDYPSSFTAKPTDPKTTFNESVYVSTDEAYFTSSDGSVEFFIYSPLWSGNPKTYLAITSNEEIVSEKTEEVKEGIRPGQFGDRIVRWVTIRAKDGAYHRSFVSIREQVGTGSELHHVFGIKYKDAAAYEAHKGDFEHFKASLRQYAD